VKFCDGPKQDECGSWYCPAHSEDDEYNCETCQHESDLAVDRKVEEKWERDTWG
jgi:hypothetical protein